MNREVAQKLSPVTSSSFWQRGIEAYVQSKEADYQNQLLNANSIEAVKEIVGRIREVRTLLNLASLVESNKNG